MKHVLSITMPSYGEDNLISLLFSFCKGNRMDSVIDMTCIFLFSEYIKQNFMRRHEQ